MAITSAIKGAKISRDELLSSFGNSAQTDSGAGLANLVSQGIVRAGEGGFEFLKNFDFSSNQSLGATTPTASTTDPINKVLTGEGLISPLDEQSIASAQESAARLNRESAESIFGPRLQRAEELGEAQVSTAEGVAGQSQQFNLSTARLSLINNLQGRIEDRIGAIEKEKQTYIDTGDFQAQQRADTQLAELRDYNNQLLFKQADFALGREEARKDAVDPFFKGSDVVNIMKELGEGETTTITDPSTGTVFQLQGIGSEDPNTKTIQSTDDKGNVTVTTVDIATGEVISQSQIKGIGKTKTAATSINFPRQSRDPIFDAQGTQVGFQIFNPITGSVENMDFENNPIDFPVGGRIGGVSSDFSEDGGEDLFD